MDQPAAVRVLPTPAPLIAWGGGDDAELIRWLANRYAAPLAAAGLAVEVVPSATPRKPLASGRAYADAFRAAGFAQANVLHVVPPNADLTADTATAAVPGLRRRYVPDSPAYLRRAETAGLLFFSGGDQERLTEALFGTRLLDRLRARHRAGTLVVAGTSAGAAALPDRMIVSGYGYRSLLAGRVEVIPGLGFQMPAPVLLDQHFTERGRFARLTHAVLLDPRRRGLGLGEETGAVLYPDGRVEVIGEGVLTVLDGRRSQAPALVGLPRNQPISGTGVRLDLLTAGQVAQL